MHLFIFLLIISSTAYIREPQATPLIPATSSQSSNVIAVFTQNPIMFVIVAVMILLIVILLIGFLLMTRAKKRRSAEIKRLDKE